MTLKKWRKGHLGEGCRAWKSGMMKRDGGHVKGEGVGLDDSNEEGSCPVHARDLKLRMSKTQV